MSLSSSRTKSQMQRSSSARWLERFSMNDSRSFSKLADSTASSTGLFAFVIKFWLFTAVEVSRNSNSSAFGASTSRPESPSSKLPNSTDDFSSNKLSSFTKLSPPADAFGLDTREEEKNEFNLDDNLKGWCTTLIDQYVRTLSKKLVRNSSRKKSVRNFFSWKSSKGTSFAGSISFYKKHKNRGQVDECKQISGFWGCETFHASQCVQLDLT